MVKKVTEALAGFATRADGIPMVCVRPSGIWGPGGRNSSRRFALPGLVHAALRTDTARPDQFSGFREGDAGDLCYVKDRVRAIALIQTARHLSHATYNIGGGRAFTNGDVVSNVSATVLGFTIHLTPGRPPATRTIRTSTSHDSAAIQASSLNTASKRASVSTSHNNDGLP